MSFRLLKSQGGDPCRAFEAQMPKLAASPIALNRGQIFRLGKGRNLFESKKSSNSLEETGMVIMPLEVGYADERSRSRSLSTLLFCG
jgi:hypothetical protein